MRAVTCAVLQTVGDKNFSPDLSIGISNDAQAYLKSTLVNTQPQSSSPPHHEAEGVKGCAAVNIKRRVNYACRPRLNPEHQNIGRFDGGKGAPVLAGHGVNRRGVDADLRQSAARDPSFPRIELHKVETSPPLVRYQEDGRFTGPHAQIC